MTEQEVIELRQMMQVVLHETSLNKTTLNARLAVLTGQMSAQSTQL